MKPLSVLLAMLVIALSSCTKEQATIAKNVYSKLLTVKATFRDEHNNNYAVINKQAASPLEGNWDYGQDPTIFTKKVPQLQVPITFFQSSDEDYNTHIGELNFNLNLQPSTEKDHTFTGTGEWYLTNSSGILKNYLKAGAGTLTYTEYIDPPDGDGNPQQPDVILEFSGYTNR